MLKTGDKFTAKFSDGAIHNYIFKGIEPFKTGYIVLWNIDLNEETCVDSDWFNIRVKTDIRGQA